MKIHELQSDQLYTWSDTNAERTRGRIAKTPQRPPAPIAPAQSHSPRLPHRALQTMWQARMQMRRRSRSCPKYYLSVSCPGLRPQMDYVPQEAYAQTAEFLGSLLLAFHAFHSPAIFHSSLPCRFFVLPPTSASFALGLAFRLLILLGVLHPVARDVQLDDHAMMHQPVDGCRRHYGVFGRWLPISRTADCWSSVRCPVRNARPTR